MAPSKGHRPTVAMAALWPPYVCPGDLADIETVPLEARGLPPTTYEVLRQAAQQWPDRAAVTVIPEAARWQHPTPRTFSELHTDVVRAANLMHDLGVRRDQAVGIMAPNCNELITATLAAQLAGVAAPVNSALHAEHVNDLFACSGARVLVSAAPELDSTSWETTRRLVQQGAVDTVLVLRPTGAQGRGAPPSIDGVKVMYLTEDVIGNDSTTFAGTAPQAGDLAALFHTGGTTGAPRLAAHTHRNEVSNAWMVAALTETNYDPVIFAALPLFHVNALMVTVLAPLLRGYSVVWAGPLGYRDPELYAQLWKIVSHYKITTMSAVPTVYGALAQCPVDADISSLRVPIVGASALPATVRADFEAHTRTTLVEGYGLTEATCVSARTFADFPREGSVGQRLPYQQITAMSVDDDGGRRMLVPGRTGHLMIKGPNVFAGYVTGYAGERFILDDGGKLIDGWLDTEDLGSVDSDGFVYLSGRAKDLIIRGGHNIDPAIIEDALLCHPDVTAAMAVGRPDMHSGEVPVAYVSLRASATATADDLRTWARAHVAESAAAPRHVTVCETLPLTAVGKPYKVPLRARETEGAVREALTGLELQNVEVRDQDGGIVVIVVIPEPGERQRAQQILGRFAFTYRVQSKL